MSDFACRASEPVQVHEQFSVFAQKVCPLLSETAETVHTSFTLNKDQIIKQTSVAGYEMTIHYQLLQVMVTELSKEFDWETILTFVDDDVQQLKGKHDRYKSEKEGTTQDVIPVVEQVTGLVAADIKDPAARDALASVGVIHVDGAPQISANQTKGVKELCCQSTCVHRRDCARAVYYFGTSNRDTDLPKLTKFFRNIEAKIWEELVFTKCSGLAHAKVIYYRPDHNTSDAMKSTMHMVAKEMVGHGGVVMTCDENFSGSNVRYLNVDSQQSFKFDQRHHEWYFDYNEKLKQAWKLRECGSGVASSIPIFQGDDDYDFTTIEAVKLSTKPTEKMATVLAQQAIQYGKKELTLALGTADGRKIDENNWLHMTLLRLPKPREEDYKELLAFTENLIEIQGFDPITVSLQGDGTNRTRCAVAKVLNDVAGVIDKCKEFAKSKPKWLFVDSHIMLNYAKTLAPGDIYRNGRIHMGFRMLRWETRQERQCVKLAMEKKKKKEYIVQYAQLRNSTFGKGLRARIKAETGGEGAKMNSILHNICEYVSEVYHPGISYEERYGYRDEECEPPPGQ